MHTTCYSDVLHSLLQCNAYYKEWNTKFGPAHGRQSDVMTQERRRWSIVSKSARGLYLLDADLKREFRREGVNPTAWVWPDRMSVYLHMNHKSETVYNERGPGAYQALASGNVPASFRGLPVYTSYPLDTDFNGAPISLLERDRMIGEWFYMMPKDKIAIFSAEHDKFMVLDYDIVKKFDMRRNGTDSAGGSFAGTKINANGERVSDSEKPHPLLIFRPFQTVSVFTCLPVARSYLSPIPSLIPLCNHSGRWRRASCSRRVRSSATRSVSKKKTRCCPHTHTFLTLFQTFHSYP